MTNEEKMTPEEAIAEISFLKVAVNKVMEQALDMAIKALEQEPCDEDAISRKRALEPYKYLNDDDVITVWMIKKNINELPSVTQKSGKWILLSKSEDGNGNYMCSNCYKGDIHEMAKSVPYCWFCGAKMESEE